MKFLVIGASGYIGEHCYRHLKSCGYAVRGTRFRSGSPELAAFDLSQDAIASVVGKSFFTGSEKTFAIIFAAFSQVERCFREKKESRLVNVDGTIRLLKDLVDLGVTPIYISTSAVYDGLRGDYNEENPPNPHTEYGQQKFAVETFIRENLPQALVFRLDKIVGDTLSERNFFSEWHNLLKREQPILCLDNIISPTYIEDIAKSILISCEKDMAGIYHLANTEIFRREELARQFASVLGRKGVIKLISEKELGFGEFRPPKTFLNSTKFIKATGFKFTPMQEVFARFKSNLNFKNKGSQENE